MQSSRILVVDDNASNRDVLERRLVRDGHQIVTAATGTSALERSYKSGARFQRDAARREYRLGPFSDERSTTR